MKISKPVTSWVSGKLNISWNQEDYGKALDLGDACMTLTGYACIKSVLKYHNVILTNHDIISHDDAIDALHYVGVTVVLYTDKKLYKVQPNKQRLTHARVKLEKAGVKVKYFASRATAERYISKLK